MIDLLPLHVRMAHPLTIKERIWANGRQVLRVDIENIEKPNKVLEDEWFDRICSVLNKKQISCVIFSDYDKGTLTDNLIQRITDVCNQDNIPTILDPKRPSFYKLKNLTLIKPNVREINSTNFEPFEVSRK
ncbi:MAG: hypothetical protein GWN01_13275, partial [Nitrosopumilaceae archaeon]|nr:hypothetical protein [Nitrosopumilaceae archaeon]NIU88249.1 hypothetical protein [Nitrosopumilaceae archaeon]NIV66549.1 hypothetical protein [Nitrosopumilaceae archaeon]NIX62437.1 hypothetical protein [Nitrosopumilaceae archaeon]